MLKRYELNFDHCTKDPMTCPLLPKAIELEIFEEQIQDLDDAAEDWREVLGQLIVACTGFYCPGQDPELTRYLVERGRGMEG